MATGGGGWAAIARLDAAVEAKPDIQSLLSTAGLKTVVVDANAIIGGGVKLAGIADQFFSVQEVLAEIRDPASRFHLATLPVEIKCLEPSEEALTKVGQFARATGDLQSLSGVDLKLIALTYTLEAQIYGTDHIRTRPPPLVRTTAKGGERTKDPPGWGSVPNPEEWEGIEDEGDSANTGSRILGLKSLSLDAPESNSAGVLSGQASGKEVIVNLAVTESSRSTTAKVDKSGSATPVSEDPKETLHGAVNVETTQREPLGSNVVHDPKSEGVTPIENDESSPMVSGNHDGSPDAAIDVESTQTEPLQEVDRNKIPDTLARFSKAVESNSISKVEADADDDDWQRAVSRSTRRQYLKRAQRRAVRQQLQESLAGSEARDTGNEELKEVKYAEEHSDIGLAHSAASFRSDISADADVAKHEDQLAESGSDQGADTVEFTDEGLFEDDAVIDGADSVDGESIHNDDTACSTDGTASVLDTEQSWGVTPMWTSSVACMTGDFAMQNVILLMGLRLLSPSGRHVKELNKWVLKCQACFKVTPQTDRMFCPKCGNGGTLFKVSITVGPNGYVLAGRNRRPVLRGTRYSLPLPKGGREGALINPILREDQLPSKPRKAKNPQEFEAFSSSDVAFAHPQERKGQKGAGVRAAAAIFSGRRNPNERRRSHK